MLATTANTTFASDALIERLEHFERESRLIGSIPTAVNAATVGEFGELARESHRAADRLLKNQTAETNRLVETANQLGAHGASAFGAGFGGSVWALVEQSNAGSFLEEWQSRYQDVFPESGERSEFFVTRPGIAAFTEMSN